MSQDVLLASDLQRDIVKTPVVALYENVGEAVPDEPLEELEPHPLADGLAAKKSDATAF